MTKVQPSHVNVALQGVQADTVTFGARVHKMSQLKKNPLITAIPSLEQHRSPEQVLISPQCASSQTWAASTFQAAERS